MKLAFLFLFSILAVLVPLSAFAADSDAVALEKTLSRLFHQELLLTIAGIKPIAMVTDDKNARETVALLQRARSSGLLKNEDMGWMWIKMPDRGVGTKKEDWIIFHHDSALLRLLSPSSSTLQILRNHGFSEQDKSGQVLLKLRTVFEQMLKRQASVGLGHPDFQLTYSENAVIGIFLGYPPEEALAFASIMKEGKAEKLVGFPKARLIPSAKEKGYREMEFTHITGKSAERIQQIQRAAAQAIGYYEAEIAKGRSQIEIFNNWPKSLVMDCMQGFGTLIKPLE